MREVEALVASWIEILFWNKICGKWKVEALVASWIEISIILENFYDLIVEALVASWIEIKIDCFVDADEFCRSPCGFVD